MTCLELNQPLMILKWTILSPSQIKCIFFLRLIHIYRICFWYNDDVLREKQVFHQFLLKSYDCFWASISVTQGYPSCQPHITKVYRFSIIIVGKRLYFIILVLWFRWKRRFPNNEANCTNWRPPLVLVLAVRIYILVHLLCGRHILVKFR